MGYLENVARRPVSLDTAQADGVGSWLDDITPGVVIEFGHGYHPAARFLVREMSAGAGDPSVTGDLVVLSGWYVTAAGLFHGGRHRDTVGDRDGLAFRAVPAPARVVMSRVSLAAAIRVVLPARHADGVYPCYGYTVRFLTGAGALS